MPIAPRPAAQPQEVAEPTAPTASLTWSSPSFGARTPPIQRCRQRTARPSPAATTTTKSCEFRLLLLLIQLLRLEGGAFFMVSSLAPGRSPWAVLLDRPGLANYRSGETEQEALPPQRCKN